MLHSHSAWGNMHQTFLPQLGSSVNNANLRAKNWVTHDCLALLLPLNFSQNPLIYLTELSWFLVAVFCNDYKSHQVTAVGFSISICNCFAMYKWTLGQTKPQRDVFWTQVISVYMKSNKQEGIWSIHIHTDAFQWAPGLKCTSTRFLIHMDINTACVRGCAPHWCSWAYHSCWPTLEKWNWPTWTSVCSSCFVPTHGTKCLSA